MGGGRAQWVLCTTHLHTLCRGLPVFPPPCNPWVLYGTPRLLMGAGYPKNPGEAEHVPQGAPAPGLCWGPMGWGRWCGTRGMMVVECGEWCRGEGVVV